MWTHIITNEGKYISFVHDLKGDGEGCLLSSKYGEDEEKIKNFWL